MSAKTGLKPCPFCGGPAQFMRAMDQLEVTGVFCRFCKAKVTWPLTMGKRETFGENEEKWAKRWNGRYVCDEEGT